ncbi:flagellar export protein FliJ [Aliibacillus thermotolerans]|uniref:Flagellar FliJ protein n=1 Tax=Aliibacillus thermotolerans TaxID=1834418 RepID=A0ABW0U5Q2_9BACI|nr:flagellar export protein FliJ [Aliibacillus thermotolerans]
MGFTYSFQQILELKEREKEAKEQEYQQSVNQFEKVATALYELLRQKEQIEEMYEKKMKEGMLIQELQQNEKALFQLTNEIQAVTKKTNIARLRMQKKEEEMKVATIEWKKYEKMKERAHENYKEEVKKEEAKQMDELSLRKYAFRT